MYILYISYMYIYIYIKTHACSLETSDRMQTRPYTFKYFQACTNCSCDFLLGV